MKNLCQQIYLERLNNNLYSEYVSNNLKYCLIKEIIQENILCGLSRNNFFRKTNFNGGTALRLFYGLDRFSEDLDFSVKTGVTDFDVKEYIDGLRRELESSGLQNEIVVKSEHSDKLQRIFVNFPAYLTYGEAFGDKMLAETVQQNQKIKIKIEVDTQIPEFAVSRNNYYFSPFPFEVSIYDEGTLFACKIGAVLGRNRKTNVKGRDFYDYVFYISRGSIPNMKCLQSVLEMDNIKIHGEINRDILVKLLCDKFNSIDYKIAKNDVMPLIVDTRKLDVWNAEFFSAITENNLMKSLL